MMTGFPIVSSGKGGVSGYTALDRVVTHLLPTMAGMVHRMEEVILDRFSAAVSGPGAGSQVLAVQFTAVHSEAAPSAIRVHAERDPPLLRAQASGDPLARSANDRQENNYLKSQELHD